MLGFVWALVVPPFQVPDETSHFGYLQAMADGRLPGDQRRPGFTSEQILAGGAANAFQTAAISATRPEWSRPLYERWLRDDAASPAKSRNDGGGYNAAGPNPPTYYLYEAIPYHVVGGDVFDRLYAARIASLLWLLVTVAGAWLLAGEVFGRNRVLQLTTAGVAGLWPMVSFLSAAVNPDSMLYALWTLALWLGARLIKRGLTPASGAAFLAVVGLTCWLRPRATPFCPPQRSPWPSVSSGGDRSGSGAGPFSSAPRLAGYC